MHRLALLAALSTLAPSCTTPDGPPATSPSDFAVVLGTGWTGTLTYRDYRPPHDDVKLPVEATITADADGVRVAWSYPTEPHANSAAALQISADGHELDGAPLVARTQRDDAVELTTRAPGQDDDRPATIEHTFSLAPRRLVIRKTVQFGDEAPIRRNEYVLTR